MLLGAVHNRQCVLCVFQLGSKRCKCDKMAGIPERCVKSGSLYLCGQTVKEASEEAFVILLSQKILDFFQGWPYRRRIFYSDDYAVLNLFCRTS